MRNFIPPLCSIYLFLIIIFNTTQVFLCSERGTETNADILGEGIEDSSTS